MSYLVGEILLYLVCVAFLGVIVGWLFTRSTYKQKVEDAEVAMLSQLHDVTTKLDSTQQELDLRTKALTSERAKETDSYEELQKVQADLTVSRNKFDIGKKQFAELNISLERATGQLQTAEEKLASQHLENKKMTRDFDQIKSRLSVFQSDLDEIVSQSGALRAAFERARLDIVNKDKRISELESKSSEGLQIAAVTGTTEPELAISRIARLQSRVQELYDEVALKDEELKNLKTSVNVSDSRIDFSRLANAHGDDLQQIGGIGGVLEEKLNKMGITRFKDIAAWSDQDIQRVDKELDFHGRIKRENWVGQASKLSQARSPKSRGH